MFECIASSTRPCLTGAAARSCPCLIEVAFPADAEIRCTLVEIVKLWRDWLSIEYFVGVASTPVPLPLFRDVETGHGYRREVPTGPFQQPATQLGWDWQGDLSCLGLNAAAKR